MELQILLFGIALPTVIGLLYPTARRFVGRVRDASTESFLGGALAATLALSALSQESPRGFPAQGRWLWFPVAVASCAAVACAAAPWILARARRAALAAALMIAAAMCLQVPEWGSAAARLSLGVGAAALACGVLWFAVHRPGFSTPCALSLALVSPSMVAMLSGFAKLAVPIGAVSCCLGFASLLSLGTASRMRGESPAGSTTRTPAENTLGFSGVIVVAATAALGAATGYGYDTVGVPAPAWLLAGAAPLGLALGELPLVRSRRALAAAARIAGCAIASAAAIVIAALA
jgi:hypothetical protein